MTFSYGIMVNIIDIGDEITDTATIATRFKLSPLNRLKNFSELLLWRDKLS